MSFIQGPLFVGLHSQLMRQSLVSPHALGFLSILELCSPSGSRLFCGMLFMSVSTPHMDCKLS